MARAAGDVRPDLEDAGIELGHRAMMRSISSHSAMRLATGVSSGVTWVEARELEKPSAPAFSASWTARAMPVMSSSVAFSLSARRPITYMRSAEWPIYMP
jgi:hypothetical protein